MAKPKPDATAAELIEREEARVRKAAQRKRIKEIEEAQLSPEERANKKQAAVLATWKKNYLALSEGKRKKLTDYIQEWGEINELLVDLYSKFLNNPDYGAGETFIGDDFVAIETFARAHPPIKDCYWKAFNLDNDNSLALIDQLPPLYRTFGKRGVDGIDSMLYYDFLLNFGRWHKAHRNNPDFKHDEMDPVFTWAEIDELVRTNKPTGGTSLRIDHLAPRKS